MSRRPVIGSAYRPHRYEHRTPTEYRALRPAMDADAMRVQAALLAQRDPDRVVGAAIAVLAVVLAVLLTTGVIQ